VAAHGAPRAASLPWGMIYTPEPRDLNEIVNIVSVAASCLIILLFLAYYVLR
jgi:hypothetical protein